MIHYYSRSHTDEGHLYKYDDETNQFYWMDHCWTGEGVWCLRDCPIPGIIEISEERAQMISKGTLFTAPGSDR